MFKTKRWT